MNRYRKANDAIHAPGHLTRAVCKTKKRRSLRISAAAATAAIVLFAAMLLRPASVPQEETPNNFPLNTPLIPVASAAEVLSSPTYPSMNPSPDFSGEWTDEEYEQWWESRRAQWQQRPEDDSALYDFYAQTAREFLTDTDGENALYSPLNLYISLGMLAEITGGETRAQLLDLLNCDTVEELRSFVSALWNVNYCDDGTVTSLLASSLWLRDDMEYNMDTLNILADSYYASSHRGTMGSQDYNDMLRNWMNENTGNLLSDQIQDLELDSDVILALVSTLYYKAGWANTFSDARTSPDVFHTPGGDVTVDFMHESSEQTYYWGDHFSAVYLSLAESGRMWFLLPDEDSSVDELLEGDALNLITDPASWENRKNLTVNLSIPKFDVSSQINLGEGLQSLGITDAFDWQRADFSPVCENADGLFLSSAIHGTRVQIDEQGCVGAAYTMLTLEATAGHIPFEEIDFTADRPFLFAVTGLDNQILFLGVVNRP